MEMGFSKLLLLSLNIYMVLDCSLFIVVALCFQCVVWLLVVLSPAFDSAVLEVFDSPLFSLSISMLIIFSINRVVVWSIKCQKMGKSANHSRPR